MTSEVASVVTTHLKNMRRGADEICKLGVELLDLARNALMTAMVAPAANKN
jgi:hypothetical protein